MSVAAAQAENFYSEVLANKTVWGIRDAGGFPAPKNGDGKRAMPFWSLKSRARTVIGSIAAYSGFEPEPIDLAKFIGNWLPGLEKDEILVGLNWSGSKAKGYDVEANSVLQRLLGT